MARDTIILFPQTRCCSPRTVASWRVSGSLIDHSFASTAAVTAELIRGSGMPQSAAVVSGEAALVVQQRPTLTPGQVEALLMHSAASLKGMLREHQGAGELNLGWALTAKTPSPAPSSTPPPVRDRGSHPRSIHIVAEEILLPGEQDISAPGDAAAGSSPMPGGTIDADHLLHRRRHLTGAGDL